MRVLVTGSSGCVAAALLPALCEDAAIESVSGIDLRPARYQHSKFRAHRINIADRLSTNLLRSHHALVHLAYVVLRGRRTENAMRLINVEASMRVLNRAAESGVERLITLSSAAVYGSGIDLSEQAPLAPLPGFCYAQQKAELERKIAAELPRCLRLRPHVILGRHAQPLLRFLLTQPCYPRLPEPEPKLQCVHELDVVAAIKLALGSSVSGAVNLAAPQTFSFADAIRARHEHAVALSPRVAQRLLDWCLWFTGYGGEPGWMQGLFRSLTLDCSRARNELGWAPQHAAPDALNATLR